MGRVCVGRAERREARHVTCLPDDPSGFVPQPDLPAWQPLRIKALPGRRDSNGVTATAKLIHDTTCGTRGTCPSCGACRRLQIVTNLPRTCLPVRCQLHYQPQRTSYEARSRHFAPGSAARRLCRCALGVLPRRRLLSRRWLLSWQRVLPWRRLSSRLRLSRV